MALIGCGADDDSPGTDGGQDASFLDAALMPTGASCALDSDCASGFCTDSVCCASRCGGASVDCQACSVAEGASADGTCAVLVATTTCRASGGACDPAESCDGSSTACPADVREAAGTICRASGGSCDLAEVCDGSQAACPGDVRMPAGIPCRALAGPCDALEVCDGTAAACPADQKRAAGTTCDVAATACDADDTCDGTSDACPDLFRPEGTPCDDGLACTVASACQLGVCAPSVVIDCSDQNRCTTDVCIEPSGCTHVTVTNCIP